MIIAREHMRTAYAAYAEECVREVNNPTRGGGKQVAHPTTYKLTTQFNPQTYFFRNPKKSFSDSPSISPPKKYGKNNGIKFPLVTPPMQRWGKRGSSFFASEEKVGKSI